MEGVTKLVEKISTLEVPGLTVQPEVFRADFEQFLFTLSLWDVKRESRPAFWCVIVGGTGTGKSTLFNCLCGFPASLTGVERPKTRGIIIAPYGDKVELLAGKFKNWNLRVRLSEAGPISGAPECISLINHKNTLFPDWVFVDTPDLDSLELSNRKLAEWMVSLADIVLFVLSQEKYADMQLIAYLDRFVSEGRNVKIVVNKVDYHETIVEDVRDLIKSRWKAGGPESGDILALPYNSSVVLGGVTDEVCEPLRNFLVKRCPAPEKARIMEVSDKALCERLVLLCGGISSTLAEENREIDRLIEKVKLYGREIYQSLIHSHGQEVINSAKAVLQDEIRRLYAKYDFLAGPRRIFRKILGAPLRLLGILSSPNKTPREQILSTIRESIDYSTVMAALDKYVRNWYELLSPYEKMPIVKVLKDPGLILSGEEVMAILNSRSERLFSWLEEQFSELSKGIPKTKEWGIYSTVILWAIFTLSIEAALGGGISLFEAALDSVIAPFVSKGAVEWFAKRDIERIGKELIQGYRQVLEEVINMQRDKFVAGLRRLRIGDDIIGELELFRERFLRGTWS